MEQRVFSEPYSPAYLDASRKDSPKKFQIIPQKNPINGQVHFLVEGDGIDEALAELYANKPVGSLDLIGALKNLRSSIYALRDHRKESIAGNGG